MEKYISKSDIVAEIEKLKSIQLSIFSKGETEESCYKSLSCISGYNEVLSFLDTLEVIDPYEQRVQYDSIKGGIQAQAETYSFNIESELYNQQTTKEGQKLWRKEIEQAFVIGGEVGVELARDPRYKENIEANGVDLDNALSNLDENIKEFITTKEFENESALSGRYWAIAKYAFLLGLKAQKGE